MTKKDCEILADLLYPNCKDISYYINKYKPRETKGEVTRIAPSPTGYLHIGHLYQGIVDSFLAHTTGGVFYVRLEDTDEKREVAQAGEIAYQSLLDYGIVPDEGYRGMLPEIGKYGPYIQTQRVEIYRAFAHHIVSLGKAFPCFCNAAENKAEILKRREKEISETNDIEVKDPCRDLTLEQIKQNLLQGKPFALRLKSCGDANKTTPATDCIMGTKDVRQNTKDDVLIKSNGVPVYAFAHVVDDLLMHTTTVVRGQDWYQSLPVHLELASAFGVKFKYAHTPNICIIGDNGNKRKISKRYDSFADVRFFLEKGYPPVAIVEYLLNLINSNFEQWRNENPTTPYKEFPFNIKKMGTTNPMFDFAKLNDVSKTIISRMTAQEVYNNALAWAEKWDKTAKQQLEKNKQVLLKMLSIDRGGVRPRKDITYYSEILNLYAYVLPNFKPNYQIDLGQVNLQKLKEFLTDYSTTYKQAEENSAWFEHVKELSAKYGFVDNKTYKQNPAIYSGSVADTSKFIRLAITGQTNSPELFSIMNIVGEKECKERIKNLLSKLK